MKVAVVHNLSDGGAHRRLTEQALRLDAEVIEVCLATATPVTDEPLVIPYEPRAPSAPRALRPPLRYADQRQLMRAWAAVTRELEAAAPDVIYANSCRYLQAPPALRELSAPSLYFCEQVRRVDYERSASRARNRATLGAYWPLYRLERRIDRGGTAAATRLATNSRFTAAEIKRCYGRVAEVVPLGVSAAFLAPPAPADPRHFLSVGMLIPQKGHELAIRAVAAAGAALPLLLFSPRPNPSEARRLEALAGELGVELTVEIGADDRRLRSAYSAAAATLYLAEREPLGLVSLEAQACGCPVVVAAEGGLPETIVEGRTGFAVPREVHAVAEAIGRLARPELRAQIGAAGAEHARGLTWERSAESVGRMLNELRRGAS